jgi:MFS family permease
MIRPPHGSISVTTATPSVRFAGRTITDRHVTMLSYAFCIAILTAGYYYNLTFVQLGLIDLGTRVVGMSEGAVSAAMAGMALGALGAAVSAARIMDARGWTIDLQRKLKLISVVIGVQTGLTIAAPWVASPAHFVAWVGTGSIAIGVGIPATFSLVGDLIAVRHRGGVAAVMAGGAFFAAALYPFEWRLEEFASVMSVAMVPAWLIISILAFRRTWLVDSMIRHRDRVGPGRFCRPDVRQRLGLGFGAVVGAMFFVFFIDSLGFLRIIEAPVYITTSWQSPDIGTRAFIAVAHLIGAAMAGVLYTAFGRRWLLTWIFGLFAFTHLLYTFHIRTAADGLTPPLALPLFYVLAVSFYTTLNFAIWADMSDSSNLATRTAIGVGVAGWLASFLSTSLALFSEWADVSLLDHLTYVNALALLLAVGFPVGLYVRRARALAMREAAV